MINQPYTLDDLNIPTILMCCPFTMDNRVSNNVLMKETEGKQINYNKVFNEFIRLYNYVAGRALVYLLPHAGNFQDQVFTANGGIVLPHVENPTIVLSNFTSPPRWDEEKVYDGFFRQMKYNVVKCPHKFEGEADLKWIRGNTYTGGYGIRTELKTHYWLEEKFDCNIITVEMREPKTYHYDCLFFPLSQTRALVTTSLLQKKDVKNIEKYVEIIEMPARFAFSGMTNIFRLGDNLLCRKLRPEEEKWFDQMCREQGLTPTYFPLESMNPQGADLSCCIMTINYCKYKSNPVVNVGNHVKDFYSGKRCFV